MKIVEHKIRLSSKKLVLRPMTEEDWDFLYRWNNDPEILYFSETEDIVSQDMDRVQKIYRTVSLTAYCFIIEYDGTPIGECWLQKMNLKRILARYPDKDCRRIDILIGEKEYWNRGIGTETIRMLTGFGFEAEMADLIFGCDIAYDNPRSIKAFTHNGYVVDAQNKTPEGEKIPFRYDLVVGREQYAKAYGW